MTNGEFIEEYVFENSCTIQLNLNNFLKLYEYAYQMINHLPKKNSEDIKLFHRVILKN